MSIEPRCRCTALACTCVVFVSACPPNTPPEALVCFCSHGYEDHDTPAHPVIALPAKGGCSETSCPRFTYTLSTPPNPQSLCSARTPIGLCGQTWLAHSLPATGSALVVPLSAPQAMVSPTVPPATLWQAPVSRVHGGQAISNELTNDRRVAHYSQLVASGRRGQGITGGPFGGVTSSAPARRQASNTRSPRLGLRVLSGSQKNSPSVPLTENFDVLIIPYSLFNSTNEANDPFHTNFYVSPGKLPRLQRQLAEYSLSFTAMVTTTSDVDPVWTQVGDQILAHLSGHEYVLQRYHSLLVTPDDREYAEEAYQFLVPGNRKPDGTRKLKSIDGPGRLITLRYLRDIASKIQNPRSQNLLVWVCPTLANITGPLPQNLGASPGEHFCLARRAMDGFLSESQPPGAIRLEPVTCLPQCPVMRLQVPDASDIDLSSPVVNILSSFEDSFLPSVGGPTAYVPPVQSVTGPSAGTSSESHFDRLIGLDPPSDVILNWDGAVALASWQQEVAQDLWEPVTASGESLSPPGRSILGNSITRFHLSAPDVDVAAEAFIKWIRAKFSGQSATLPPMVDINEQFNLHNIFHSRRVWSVGNGIGVGVERSMLTRVIEFSSNDLKLCWGDCDTKTGYRHLNTSSILDNPQRRNNFQALGWICASYIFMTGQGLEPFCPTLPLFAIGGWKALTDLPLIDQVMPDHAAVLQQWPTHYDDRTIANLEPGSNLAMLVIDHLDMNPAELTGLDQNAWNSVTKAFYSALLFGSPDLGISESPPIASFVHGFKIRVSSSHNLCDTLLKDDRYKIIIPAIYNRSIKDPLNVISNLRFISAEDQDIDYPTDVDSQALPMPEEAETLFMVKLYRYLRGRGHPQDPRITNCAPFADECASTTGGHQNEEVLRARLFLYFATGSELLPTGAWSIKIKFVNELPPGHSHSIPQDVGPDWQPLPIPLYAQTCARQIQVAINKTSLTYIKESLPHDDDGTVVTMFDVWIHTSLMRSGGAHDFNTT